MQPSSEQLRHEYKYLINYPGYLSLRHSLMGLLKPDEHAYRDGSYRVTSLYFDDELDSGVHSKLSGVTPRHRYRVRFYDSLAPSAFLERKSKYGDLTGKVREPLTGELLNSLMAGDARDVFSYGTPLAREVYALMRMSEFRPRIYVHYTREALVHSSGTLRVTFDRDVAYSTHLNSPRIPILPNVTVLEVKFIDYAPQYILKLIANADFARAAISKYVLCRMHEGHIYT